MKLKVKNLAKIKEASIEIKNLTLFVGQNSTNKSYMAHIVYELFKEISNLSRYHRYLVGSHKIIRDVAYKVLPEYEEKLISVKKEFSEHIEEEQISEDEWDHFVRTKVSINLEPTLRREIFDNIKSELFNKLLELTNNSFNGKNVIIEDIFIDIKNNLNDTITFYVDDLLNEPDDRNDKMSYRIIMNLINKLIDDLYATLQGYTNAYYFPASRTGFVLAHEEIYAGTFRDKFRGQASSTKLGEPTIDFIQKFADIKMGKSMSPGRIIIEQPKQDITNKLTSFLEENIIKGSIKESITEQDYRNYYLSINNKEIDLHMASSATLETLPFVVFIKNTEDISKTLFVIEEPEAHLHPKAQLQMARFIVMLSNAGAKVVVTTHSDYILGEINNCIKKYELDGKSDFSISKDYVSAYLFKDGENDKSETIVKPLDIDNFGISDENFDEALNELLEESGELTDEIVKNEK